MTVADVLRSWGVDPAVLDRLPPAVAQKLFTALGLYAVALAEKRRVAGEVGGVAAANYADWVTRAGRLMLALTTGSLGAEAGMQLGQVLAEASDATADGISIQLPDVALNLRRLSDALVELPAQVTGSIGHALRAGVEGAIGVPVWVPALVGIGVVLLGGWYLGPALVAGSTRMGLAAVTGYGRASNTLAKAAPALAGVFR